MTDFDFHEAFDGLFRQCYGRVCSALAKEFRDLELAEDALQEALLVAARKWPLDGLPDNAAGWLFVVARHKAIDALRREARQRKQVRAGFYGSSSTRTSARWIAATDAYAGGISPNGIAPPEGPSDSPAMEATFAQSPLAAMYGIHGPPDERLSLIFACCHPAISEPAQVALTLHTLTGISTADIAASFLLKESAVAQRIVRAKRKIKQAGIPLTVPDIENSPERLSGVLSVIYLIFNAGYSAHAGPTLLKTDLCDEAIFLARMLSELLSGIAEIQGLLALLLFQDSRREARVAADGTQVLLGDQNRALWDRQKIGEGMAILSDARKRQNAGFYFVQAEIAAFHATAPTAAHTDWARILRHYDKLLEIRPNPVVVLNRAVALSKARGPTEALLCLEDPALASALNGYRYYHSTRAEFLLDLNRGEEAKVAFERAIQLTENEQERNHLRRRLKATMTGG